MGEMQRGDGNPPFACNPSTMGTSEEVPIVGLKLSTNCRQLEPIGAAGGLFVYREKKQSSYVLLLFANRDLVCIIALSGNPTAKNGACSGDASLMRLKKFSSENSIRTL